MTLCTLKGGAVQKLLGNGRTSNLVQSDSVMARGPCETKSHMSKALFPVQWETNIFFSNKKTPPNRGVKTGSLPRPSKTLDFSHENWGISSRLGPVDCCHGLQPREGLFDRPEDPPQHGLAAAGHLIEAVDVAPFIQALGLQGLGMKTDRLVPLWDEYLMLYRYHFL